MKTNVIKFLSTIWYLFMFVYLRWLVLYWAKYYFNLWIYCTLLITGNEQHLGKRNYVYQ